MINKSFVQALIVLGLAVIVGIFYNSVNPAKLPFIGEEKKYDFSQSDSLLNALRIQDSLLKAADLIKNNSDKRDDSLKTALEKKKLDSLKQVKQDSVKRASDSLKIVKQKQDDSLKNAQNNQQNFVKPIDIKLDFAKALFDKKYKFIDARDESDYDAGHVQSAVNIPFHHIEQFKSKVEGMDRDGMYICYCSSTCDVSIDLAYYMAHIGFKKVYIFHGGWDEWKNAGYPTGG